MPTPSREAIARWRATLPSSLQPLVREPWVEQAGFGAGPGFVAGRRHTFKSPVMITDGLAWLALYASVFRVAHLRLVDGTTLFFDRASYTSSRDGGRPRPGLSNLPTWCALVPGVLLPAVLEKQEVPARATPSAGRDVLMFQFEGMERHTLAPIVERWRRRNEAWHLLTFELWNPDEAVEGPTLLGRSSWLHRGALRRDQCISGVRDQWAYTEEVARSLVGVRLGR